MGNIRLRDLLEWSNGTKQYIENLLKKVSDYKEIIIFGAGIGGKQTVELLKMYGMQEKIKAFSDNNIKKVGTLYEGYPVVPPEDICRYGERFIVLISSTAFDVIQRQLAELGIAKEDIYFFQPAGISLNENTDLNFIKENIQKFETVYDRLADEKSRKIYRNILNYRISKRIFWLDEMKECIDAEAIQYFDRGILSQYFFEEGFVDAGAYTGDTVNSFYKNFPKWGGHYYCFEAGKEIYRRLCQYIDSTGRKTIIPFNCALWDKPGELKFDVVSYGDSEGSRVSDAGEDVKCDTLDRLLEGKKISFIKMDIEGAERRAVMGARDIIEKNKPVLAICIYHKPEDFFDIPLLIESLFPGEYKYFVRQYRYGHSETVLYAMPNSRKIEICS